MNDITIKCPNCGLGMDIHMVKRPPVVIEHFYVGYRTCPNCDYEIDVSIAGGKDLSKTFNTTEGFMETYLCE